MNILIDTHILIWSTSESECLSPQIKQLLNDKNNNIFISVASIWETVIKHSKRSDIFPHTGSGLYQEAINAGYGVIPIEAEDALTVDSLKYTNEGLKEHKDPFDRIMLAQAKHYGLRFLSLDELVHNYNEPCILPLS